MPGRFRMHDLVREFAASQDPRDDAALHRLTEHYIHTSHLGVRRLYPHIPPFPLDPVFEGHVPQPLDDTTAALRWFESEELNLRATQRLALDLDWHTQAWLLAHGLSNILTKWARFPELLDIWRRTLPSARRAGRYGEADGHSCTGLVLGRLEQYDEAEQHLARACVLFEELGETRRTAYQYNNLGWVRGLRGDRRAALTYQTRAQQFAHETGDDVLEANTLNGMGWHHAQLGEYDEADRKCRLALDLFRRKGFRDGEADTLDSLGFIAHQHGRYGEALDHFRQALTIMREVSNASIEANTLINIAATYVALGRPDDARQSLRQALEMFELRGQAGKADETRRKLDELG